jgi:hypothetical protein
VDKIKEGESNNIIKNGRYAQNPSGENGDIDWARDNLPHVRDNFVISEEGNVHLFNKSTPKGTTNSDGKIANDFFFSVQEGKEYEKKN